MTILPGLTISAAFNHSTQSMDAEHIAGISLLILYIKSMKARMIY